MIQSRCVFGVVAGVALWCVATAAFAAWRANAPPGVSLSGYWQIDATKSDDAEQLLQQRLDKLRKERERWLRDARRTDPLGIPPLGLPPLPPEEEPVAAPKPAQKRAPRRNDDLRRMLNISDTLTIAHSGSIIDIVSELETRRFEAGSRSQVSMPQGELADSRIGWEGEWFVIERKANRGPRVVEKYRWLKKTDQLESELKWSGDTLLSGIKVHRIYDRRTSAPEVADPNVGPVK